MMGLKDIEAMMQRACNVVDRDIFAIKDDDKVIGIAIRKEFQYKDLGDKDLEDKDLEDKDLEDKDLEDKDLGDKDLEDKDLEDKDLGDKDLGGDDIQFTKAIIKILTTSKILTTYCDNYYTPRFSDDGTKFVLLLVNDGEYSIILGNRDDYNKNYLIQGFRKLWEYNFTFSPGNNCVIFSGVEGKLNFDYFAGGVIGIQNVEDLQDKKKKITRMYLYNYNCDFLYRSNRKYSHISYWQFSQDNNKFAYLGECFDDTEELILCENISDVNKIQERLIVKMPDIYTRKIHIKRYDMDTSHPFIFTENGKTLVYVVAKDVNNYALYSNDKKIRDFNGWVIFDEDLTKYCIVDKKDNTTVLKTNLDSREIKLDYSIGNVRFIHQGNNSVMITNRTIITKETNKMTGKEEFSKNVREQAIINGKVTNEYYKIEALTVSPNGKRYILVSRPGRSSRQSLLLVIDGKEQPVKYTHINKIVFSSDSKRYAFTAGIKDVSRALILDGKEILQCDYYYDAINYIGFTEDSKHLIYSLEKREEREYFDIISIDNKKEILRTNKGYCFINKFLIKNNMIAIHLIGKKEEFLIVDNIITGNQYIFTSYPSSQQYISTSYPPQQRMSRYKTIKAFDLSNDGKYAVVTYNNANQLVVMTSDGIMSQSYKTIDCIAYDATGNLVYTAQTYNGYKVLVVNNKILRKFKK